MKINRHSFIIIELILLALVIIFVLVYVTDRKNDNPNKVFVIMKNTEENYRNALIYGMRKASSDAEMDLVVVSAGDIVSLEEEQAMIQREIDNGASAIIAEPISMKDDSGIFEEINKQIPLLLINSDISKNDSLIPVSKVDNYSIGYELADRLIKDYGKTIDQKTFGIVVEDKNTEAGLNRERGCMKRFEEGGLNILWSVSSEVTAGEDSSGLGYLPKVDVIVALDDFSSIESGNAKEDGSLKGTDVYGIGNSTEAIYHLENRNISILLVPDDFELGYESFMEVSNHLKNNTKKIIGVKGTYSFIRRYDLFSDSNQKILYSMSQ